MCKPWKIMEMLYYGEREREGENVYIQIDYNYN